MPTETKKDAHRTLDHGKLIDLGKRLVPKAGFGLFLAAIAFLSFVGGSLITIAGAGPSGYLQDAYRAASALYERHIRHQDPLATDLWAPVRTPIRGVTRFNRGRSAEGLTLYTSGHATKAFLIDMEGRPVHEWSCPYSSVWDASAAVRNPVPDNYTALIKAHAFPNGDLLAIYIGVGDTPYGYGMVKLDRHSQVIWKNLDYFHHDFDVASDGRIFALTQEFRGQIPEIDHLQSPLLDDYLVILTPEGRQMKKISLLDAVHLSTFNRLLWLVPGYSLADPLHTNNVNILDEETARLLKPKIPVAAPDQVLLSFRELAGGSLALLDTETARIVWATRGPWFSQHDPDILPNGNILLFDNRGHFGDGGQSRVVEIDPGSGAMVWQYAGSDNKPLQSFIRSNQQLLPNQNILITESDAGRLLEVNRAGEIVWEYINPVRAGTENNRIAIISEARRIDNGYWDVDFPQKAAPRPPAGKE